MRDAFAKLAAKVAGVVGNPWAFTMAVLLVIGWALSGRFFHFSDTWQLVINTSTTIVTFLMVFLIQNTQNRDATAIHLKLDELLRGMKDARNTLIDVEALSDDELKKMRIEFQRLRLEATAQTENEQGAGPPADAPSDATRKKS